MAVVLVLRSLVIPMRHRHRTARAPTTPRWGTHAVIPTLSSPSSLGRLDVWFCERERSIEPCLSVDNAIGFIDIERGEERVRNPLLQSKKEV